MRSFIFILFITFNAHAAYIGIENNFRHIGMIQTDDQGSTNFLEYSPGLIVARSIPAPLIKNLWFYPGLSIFFPERSEDELYRKWAAEINLHFLKPISQQLDFSFGATYLMKLLIGSGGTSTQNNGNSTSTYFVPKEYRFIGGFAPELGIRYEFWKKRYLYLGLIPHQVLSDEARSYTLSLQLMTWI